MVSIEEYLLSLQNKLFVTLFAYALCCLLRNFYSVKFLKHIKKFNILPALKKSLFRSDMEVRSFGWRKIAILAWSSTGRIIRETNRPTDRQAVLGVIYYPSYYGNADVTTWPSCLPTWLKLVWTQMRTSNCTRTAIYTHGQIYILKGNKHERWQIFVREEKYILLK